MADLDHRTGQQIIGEMNKDILRELYIKAEIVEDYNTLRDIIKNGSPKEAIPAIKLLWEFTIEKPKQKLEGNLSLPTLLDVPESKIKDILSKIDVREADKAGETSTDPVQTTN